MSVQLMSVISQRSVHELLFGEVPPDNNSMPFSLLDEIMSLNKTNYISKCIRIYFVF